MKPIIIYIKEQDNQITISKADFEKLLSDAYEQGKLDGSPVYPIETWLYKPIPPDITPVATWSSARLVEIS